jgi:hypothetical protein
LSIRAADDKRQLRIALSGEADAGSRKENVSKQEGKGSIRIDSEPDLYPLKQGKNPCRCPLAHLQAPRMRFRSTFERIPHAAKPPCAR